MRHHIPVLRPFYLALLTLDKLKQLHDCLILACIGIEMFHSAQLEQAI